MRSAGSGQSATRKDCESTVTAEIQSDQPARRPYEATYFLPGKLAGRPVHYLLDTGCTTNLLGKHVFDKLPPHVRSQREECDSHGVMADGTQLPFFGVLRASIRVRDIKVEEAFVISQINEDAILGMPFLIAQHCAIDFGRPVLRMGDRELVCTDRHGRVLVSRVQLLREGTIPPDTEMLLLGRLNTRSHPDLGLVEH